MPQGMRKQRETGGGGAWGLEESPTFSVGASSISCREPCHESLPLASVLKMSHDELVEVASFCGVPVEENPEDTLRAFIELWGLVCVVMTRGLEGALMVSGDGGVHRRGIPVTGVDTVGDRKAPCSHTITTRRPIRSHHGPLSLSLNFIFYTRAGVIL
jgi:hypothetical protein